MAANMCKNLGYDFIVAPMQADSQLAAMLTEFRCEAVITEDSDLLVYAGVKELVSLKHWGDPSGAAEFITKDMLA